MKELKPKLNVWHSAASTPRGAKASLFIVTFILFSVIPVCNATGVYHLWTLESFEFECWDCNQNSI